MKVKLPPPPDCLEKGFKDMQSKLAVAEKKAMQQQKCLLEAQEDIKTLQRQLQSERLEKESAQKNFNNEVRLVTRLRGELKDIRGQLREAQADKEHMAKEIEVVDRRRTEAIEKLYDRKDEMARRQAHERMLARTSSTLGQKPPEGAPPTSACEHYDRRPPNIQPMDQSAQRVNLKRKRPVILVGATSDRQTL